MKVQDLKELLTNTFGHLDKYQVMGETIYGEARGEKTVGKIAVGSVILERVEHRKWDGEAIQEVCLCPFQFSCFLPLDPNFQALKLIAGDWEKKYQNSFDLQQCFAIARGLIEGLVPRTPEIQASHCCQYVTTAYRKAALKNRWWDSMKLIVTIGAHEFYA